MFTDFFFIHADVLRNAFVLFLYTVMLVGATTLVVRWLYRKKAVAEASSYLKQKIAEVITREEEVKSLNERLFREIERLTRIQNTALAAAHSIEEAVRG